MPISRRSLLKAAAAVPALSLPGIVRAESQTTLRFIPVIDLAFVDPIYSTAQVSRNHGFMVYDTLYGMSSSLQVSPQMLSGHAISGDELQWDLTLARRPVLARRRARAGARLRRQHPPLGRARRLWRRADGGDR